MISKEAQISRIKAHLLKNNKIINPKDKPVVFIAVHNVNWEKSGLVDPWKAISDVIHYDWGGIYYQDSKSWHTIDKQRFNQQLVEKVRQCQEKNHIDIFFSYLSGRWVYPETIKKIGELGIITINISLDDKMKFWGSKEPGGLSGNAEIAKYFDVCITCQSKEDVGKYIYSGANPLFLPPAGNPDTFNQLEISRTTPVSFIGQCYGVRPKMINFIGQHGIQVETYGLGWPDGPIPPSKMNEIYNRSLINLGFGYIGDSYPLTGLKGRDFEIPLAGNLYLTSYNPDLEDTFKIGSEIDCYQDKEDLLKKIRYYIENPEIARRIGKSGRDRCLKDHTWKKRYEEVLEILKV